MKTIELTNGGSTTVDDDAYSLVSQFNWHGHRGGGGNVYVCSPKWRHKYGIRQLRLHHIIVGNPLPGFVVDHIDGGAFESELEAAEAYQKAVVKLSSEAGGSAK